ncbi:MAG: hypothetical protein N3A66_01895, partial [Planctomycetota bacterium]|nr:hypothetical protein [Planctomycetota bacterium]
MIFLGKRWFGEQGWRLSLLPLLLALSVAEWSFGGEGGGRSSEGRDLFGGLGVAAELQGGGGVYDFLKDRKMVVIRNYAVVRVKGATIRARNITYSLETSEVYAEGDVSFEHSSSGSRFDCDRLFIRTSDWQGLVENMRIKASREPPPRRTILDEPALGPSSRRASGIGEAGRISRMVATAKEVRSISLAHQEMIGGAITPSLFARPHWSIQSAAVNVRHNEKVESWHNVLRIGKVPVFYFPYIIKDLRYDWPWLRFGAGHSSDWGFYTLLKYGLDLNPKPNQAFRPEEIFFDLDWRQERGWGLGSELNYQVGKGKSFGRLDAYWVKETEIDRDDDLERALHKNDTSVYRDEPNFEPDLYRDEDRWALEWWHRQQFTERWDLRMEAHKYSDRDFRREYFERDYKENKEPETAFDLRYQHENWQFEVFARKRLNAWENQSEYLPEVRISIPSFQLGRLPLYLVSATRVGWVDRRYDEALDRYGYLEGQKDIDAEIRKIKSGDHYGLFFRAHEDLRLEAPLHLGDLFVLTPWIGGRVTYYEEQFGEWVPDNLLTPAALADRRAGRWHDSFVRGDTGSKTNAAFLWGADPVSYTHLRA